MDARTSRRTFVRRPVLGGAGLVILRDSRSARTYAANERLHVALIGCGGRGAWFAGALPRLAALAALCDVDDERAAATYAKFPYTPRYHDFRKMIATQANIDAVPMTGSRPPGSRIERSAVA